jgi:hypothetical protein
MLDPLLRIECLRDVILSAKQTWDIIDQFFFVLAFAPRWMESIQSRHAGIIIQFIAIERWSQRQILF